MTISIPQVPHLHPTIFRKALKLARFLLFLESLERTISFWIPYGPLLFLLLQLEKRYHNYQGQLPECVLCRFYWFAAVLCVSPAIGCSCSCGIVVLSP